MSNSLFKTISKKLLTTLILLYSCITLFASVIPINLENRVEGAGQIMIAKVMAVNSYWDEAHQNIYTDYTMEATAYLKQANTAYTFQLILPGGEVDGEMEIVSPNVQLAIGKEYMVLADNLPLNKINPSKQNNSYRQPHFQPYALIQGILPYIDEEYWDYTEGAPMEEYVLVELIHNITNTIATTPGGETYIPRRKIEDIDGDGVCSLLDCDDNDPNYPKPVGAACDDFNPDTVDDQIQADGCTCAGNVGNIVDCEGIVISSEGGIIRIDNLNAKRERIELIGSETSGQAQLICDGDCQETEIIEGLVTGKKILKIWQYGENDEGCYKEFVADITSILCTDSDKDGICNIKDCAPNNINLPAIPGTPCDDGNPATKGDIYLADGCTCAGVETCEVPERKENRPNVIVLKNSNGSINPTFITGTTELENELVIEGTGFGTTPGNILFPNSDSGGRTLIGIDQETDINAWTNTQIRVKIPTKAGSGTITVKNSSNTTIGTGTINIGYAINSLYSSFRNFTQKTRQGIKFTNRNGNGGFTLQLNTTSGMAYSTAIPPLEKAMDTWICATGVNWQIDKSGTNIGFANDGECVAIFEPNLPVGVLAITTSRYKASGNSSCSLEKTVWYLKEFDMQFLPEAGLGTSSWNYGPWPPQAKQYDFETIALHELGHAHGLGHVIDGSEIMHFAVQSGIEKRIISHHAHEGGQYKVNQATTSNCIASHQPMTLLTPTCATNTSTSARIKIMLEGFYNPISKELKTNLLSNNLLPDKPSFDLPNQVAVANFPSNAVDWLLVELRDENDLNTVIAQKAVLVNTDGNLMDTKGNELVNFENVADKDYYIAVFHKSHLPIISNLPQPLNDSPTLFDFSENSTTTSGTDQQKQIDGKYFMLTGDFDGNGIINSLDFNIWKQAAAEVNSYSPADADGNGIINNQDFNLWKANGSKVSILQR